MNKSLSALMVGLVTVALTTGLAFVGPGVTPADAQGITLEPTDPDYRGVIWARNTEDETKPFLPGSTIRVQGQNFKPGQTVMFSQGLVPLLPEPLVANADGQIDTTLTIPEDAPVGVHPVVLSTTNPYYATIIDFKISPELPLSGEEKFARATAKLAEGLYQSAYSPAGNALFVTSAAGYPPVPQSEILKLDPETLAVTARATPRRAADGGLYGVYGLGLDDSNGTIWVTNTRHDTVAVYAQDDLRLLKQFEPGVAAHPRDVAAVDGIVYVSVVGMPGLLRFDGKTLEPLPMLPVLSRNSRKPFSPASLHVDRDSGRIYVVSLTAPEVALIDTAAGKVEKVIPVPGAVGAIGVGYDPETRQIFVAAQGTDELIVVDEASGSVVRRLPIGAGPLSVAFDPVSRLTWVASRGAGTVTAVDPQGQVVANLESGPEPNHVMADGQGGIFVVNKGTGPADPHTDRITRIRTTE